MTSRIDAVAVAARLARLRAIVAPSTREEARQFLTPPHRTESFDARATRALAELRALCELTRYLQSADVGGGTRR